MSQLPTGEQFMTVENSSLLGYVLIISGVAVGILAYAIYLILREGKSGTSSTANEKDAKSENGSPFQSDVSSQTKASLSTPLAQNDIDILIDTPISHHEADDPMAADLEKKGAPMPEKQDLIEVATILREVDTGNLIIRVEGTNYTNVDDLMDSSHWSRIERLSSDLAGWLKSTEIIESFSRTSSSDPKPLDNKPAAPKSMVEEINQILERRLKTEDIDRKAIKILENLDGSVKVYIGLDSYPIDEVPFEDVRALIREAVSEWEESR